MYLLFIELHHDVIEQEELQEVIVAGKPQGSVELSGKQTEHRPAEGACANATTGTTTTGL